MQEILARLSPDRAVLIAGPTASGKSALAIAIAQAQGGVIVNADASQVYDCWRVLTARPSPEEEAMAPHALFGHVAYDAPYSVGQWLREVTELADQISERLIVVGGTGLYFKALTDGLAPIPDVPAEIRQEADGLDLLTLCDGVSAETRARIDVQNRSRVQRAWEVERATGRPLHLWQADNTTPLLPAGAWDGVVLDAPKEWLTPRITARFALMLDQGGLDEAAAMRDRYDPALPSCKAIGVAEAMEMLDGCLSRDAAIARATIATRQYAKRQRTWFRANMADWHWIGAAQLTTQR